MDDRAVVTEDSVGLAAEPPDNHTEPLEHRVRRLEDAVAAMQDTRLVEERVVERVVSRMNRMKDPAPREATEIIIDAGRRLLPRAVEALRTKPDPVEPPPRPALPPPQSSWFLLEAWYDLRAMVRMYLDGRYRPRLSWSARVVPPILLALFLASWWWVPLTSVIVLGTVLNKAVDLVLLFVLYKFLCREARAYREAAPHLRP